MESTDKYSTFIYAYPTRVFDNGSWSNEVFVTYDEPNFFQEPYDNVGLKIFGTMFWLIGFLFSIIIYTFVVYETQGHAASYRTIINQLITNCYFWIAIFQNSIGFVNCLRAWFGPLPSWSGLTLTYSSKLTAWWQCNITLLCLSIDQTRLAT